MQPIERRIAALEAANKDDSLKVIVVEDGETSEVALARVGLPSDRMVAYITALDVLV